MNVAHAKMAKKKELKKAIEEFGVSLFAGSIPVDNKPQSSISTQFVYSIKTIDPNKDSFDVLIVNGSIEKILDEFNTMEGKSMPTSWVKLTSFI